MGGGGPTGFPRDALNTRYNVPSFAEDDWHRFSDTVTGSVLSRYLYPSVSNAESWVLNAGSGVYQLDLTSGRELSFDLFLAPIANRCFAVCGTAERLPFREKAFAAIACVGEVLSYCDPDKVISEFARVIEPGGMLVVDFGSTKSWRHLGTRLFGKTAVVLTSDYNGSPEKTWIYNPHFVARLLARYGFSVQSRHGSHAWSTLARRIGFSTQSALALERSLRTLVNDTSHADTITVVAQAKTV